MGYQFVVKRLVHGERDVFHRTSRRAATAADETLAILAHLLQAVYILQQDIELMHQVIRMADANGRMAFDRLFRGLGEVVGVRTVQNRCVSACAGHAAR